MKHVVNHALALRVVSLLVSCHTAEKKSAMAGYWKFDEGKGTVAADRMGGNHASVPQTLKWTNGYSGKAIRFNAAQPVVIKHAEYFNSAAYTLTAWVKLDLYADLNHTLFWKCGEVYPETTPTRRFDTWVERTQGTLHFSAHTAEGELIRCNDSKTRIVDGKWHHIARVYDGNLLQCYIDGKLDFARTVGPLAKNEYDLWIGARPDDSKASGVIDELKYYTRALDKETIALMAVDI